MNLFLEQAGGLLGAVTFILFGAVMLVPMLDDLTAAIVLYALLSLTVVRMVPVARRGTLVADNLLAWCAKDEPRAAMAAKDGVHGRGREPECPTDHMRPLVEPRLLIPRSLVRSQHGPSKDRMRGLG